MYTMELGFNVPSSSLLRRENITTMSEQALFRTILARCFALLRQRPSLWIFGLIASGVGGIGVIELAVSLFRFLRHTSTAPLSMLQTTSLSAVYYWLIPPYQNALLPLFAVLLICVGFLVFLVTVIALGGLIRGTVDKKPQPLITLWHHGVSHVWHMAALVIARKIVVTLLVVLGVICGYAIAQSAGAWAAGLLAAWWTVIVIAVMSASFLTIYAATAMSIDRLHVKNAVVKALQVFRRHVLLSLEMALLLFGVELIALILVAGVFVVIAVPVYLLYLVGVISSVLAIFKAGLAIALILLFVIGLLVAGFLTVFEIAAWSALYMKTREGVVMSRILYHLGVKRG